MIKRTIEISGGPTFLSIELDQLVLRRQGTEIGRVPCEDIGLLIAENHSTTFTQAVFTRLLEAGAAVVLCGPDHLPAGMFLPFAGNSLIAQRMAAQAACPLPRRKRLWRQIIRHKIAAQAANLPADHPARQALMDLAGRVRSGDRENAEGQAARIYWPALLGQDFRRDPDGLPPNNLLNYGYTVLRAAVARALCAAGLQPALGLHHRHRANPFCLADDLLEVLRPMVDGAVVELYRADRLVLDRDTKAVLLGLLTRTVTVGGQAGPLMVGLHRMAASLVRVYQGAQERLDLPEL